ncbi:MAG: hypothetical protein JSW71_02020 [Gemmatimonadota bacterium]|nr:MAG: hypothetical protein JSW71_02020 [Gemmatimonadota bacterium]
MDDSVMPLAGLATALIVLLPIVKAAARFLERKTRTGPEATKLDALRDELELVQDRLDAVERSADRVAELEGWLDFAERLRAAA